MKDDKKQSKRYPDELHRELGMTPEEVRQALIDRDIDPDAAVSAMRRLGRVMAARFAPQIEREQAPGFEAPLRIYHEAAAAGAPAWAEPGSAPSQASLRDVMAGGEPEDTILVRVSGWSMRDEGINDGDYVMVNVKREANDGDIVLAHLAGEGQVIKRLRRRRGRVALESANPDFADIEIEDPTFLRIHGVVVGRAGKL